MGWGVFQRATGRQEGEIMGKYTKELESLRPVSNEKPMLTFDKFSRLYEILCELIEELDKKGK